MSHSWYPETTPLGEDAMSRGFKQRIAELETALAEREKELTALAEKELYYRTKFVDLQIEKSHLPDQIAERDREIEALRTWQKSILDATQQAMNGSEDEVHCTCVPLLRQRIKQLDETLVEFSNRACRAEKRIAELIQQMNEMEETLRREILQAQSLQSSRTKELEETYKEGWNQRARMVERYTKNRLTLDQSLAAFLQGKGIQKEEK